jgi:hypothetical protein
MTIPKEIKIGGRRIKVEYPYDFKERSDIDGQFWQSLGVIRLSDKTSGGAEHDYDYTKKNLLHEIIHAIFDIYCGESDIGDNEHVVDGLAQGWLQVLSDNPEFIELFREG